jgi:hypothetical protein
MLVMVMVRGWEGIGKGVADTPSTETEVMMVMGEWCWGRGRPGQVH